MTSGHDEKLTRLSELDAKATQLRQDLSGEIKLAREVFRPANVMRSAGNRVLDFGLDSWAQARSAARRNPVKLIGFALLAGAVVARRPLARLLMTGAAKAAKHLKRPPNQTKG